MFARGNVSKIIFAAVNQSIFSREVLGIQRNYGRHIVRNRSVVVKSDKRDNDLIKEDHEDDSSGKVNRLVAEDGNENTEKLLNVRTSDTKNYVDKSKKVYTFSNPQKWERKFQFKAKQINSESINENYDKTPSRTSDYEDEEDYYLTNSDRKPQYSNSYGRSKPSYSNRYNDSDNYRERKPQYSNRYSDYNQSNQNWDRGPRNSGYDFTVFDRPKPEYGNFEKNFYVEQESVKNRSEAEIRQFLDQHDIKTYGSDVLHPIAAFEEAGFQDVILNKISANGWKRPSPIQCVTWPQALSGRDLVGIAQTGSGKTLGFLLPAFVHIQNQEPLRRNDGPICLVMVPTRELAQQVQTVSKEFGSVCGIKTVACYGGEDRMVQLRKLYQGAEVVIGTPGRINDFLSSGELTLDRCTYLVLDEADRMLDMGFEPQIRQIIEQIRPDRQTLMWSATWPKEVKSLARDFLGDYVQINVGSADLVANQNISQQFIFCEEHEKASKFRHALQGLMETDNKEKILIFTARKNTADHLSYKLRQARISNVCSHGDKSQKNRDLALKSFRSDQVKVMVATDVAARGLDVNDITYVINYDFPNNIEDYIHRIGRTGRANKSGTAISLFTPQDAKLAKELIAVLQDANQEVDEELKRIAFDSRRDHGPKFSKYGVRRQGSFRGYEGRGFSGHDRRGGFSRQHTNTDLKNRLKFAPGFTRLDDD